MAAPAGLLVECPIDEASLASLFKQKIAFEGGKISIGHVLSRLLDRGEDADILIAHYDRDRECLFLAWYLNHYSRDALAPIWPVLDALAAVLPATTEGKGAVATTFPELIETVLLRGGAVERRPVQVSPAGLPDADFAQNGCLVSLSDKLWSFAEKGQFPDAEGSMRRKAMQCKPFKSAWKTYRVWRDAEERPARIAAATLDTPFRLFEDVYTALGQVFRRDGFSNRDVPFADADPLTFRTEAGFHADRNHVWQRQLAAGSPPKQIQHRGHWINNQAAVWEYVHVAGAQGASFRWLFDRWDTMFWRDALRIYTCAEEGRLLALTGVDPVRFRAYGQCFGSDGEQVYYFQHRLPLNAHQMQTQGIFIWDGEKVFCRAFELPLRGEGFGIVAQKRLRGSIHDIYRLTDGRTTLLLTWDMQIHPDDPNF